MHPKSAFYTLSGHREQQLKYKKRKQICTNTDVQTF